jgi:hypothetical protein
MLMSAMTGSWILTFKAGVLSFNDDSGRLTSGAAPFHS